MEALLTSLKQLWRLAVPIALSCIAFVPSIGVAGSIDGDAYLRRGYQQLNAGDNEQAIGTLSQAVRANPASVDARRYLAHALMRSGLALQAVQQFQYVNKLCPDSPADMTSLGDAYFYAADYQAALRCYELALSENGKLDMARTGMIHTYVATGDSRRAVKLCLDGLHQATTPAARQQYTELLRAAGGASGRQASRLDE